MNKKILKYFIYVLFLLNIFLIPRSIFASELIFKLIPNTEVEEKIQTIEVRIDPQSKNLNVVEGTINFESNILDKTIVDIETGGSVLTIWTKKPEYLQNEKIISFAGGSQVGFDKESLLFRIKISSNISGNLIILSTNSKAYLSDGLGTIDEIPISSININLEKTDTNLLNRGSLDKVSPYFEFVNIGKDANTYDGKYFISFNAIDDNSGISYFEIKEGNEITKTTDLVYILKDQNRKTPISITAYDKVQNMVVYEIKAKSDFINYVIIILLVILILLLIYKNKINFKKIKND